MSNQHCSQQPVKRNRSCLEVVSIRLYDPRERKKLEETVQRISGNFASTGFYLFQNKAVEGDWAVHMWRQPLEEGLTKSKEAMFLLELLCDLGLVHHSIWMQAMEKHPEV